MESYTSNELNFIDKVLNSEVRPKINEFITTGKTNGPIVVEFDPTSNCNFSCPECISQELLNNGQLSSERIVELIHEFHKAGVKGVIFIGGGEPLAHSSMPKPIVLVRELGMAVGLTTNGSLIGRYKDEIAEHVSWTRVSLDAGTEATHSLFRPSKIKNAFSKIVSSMADLAKIKTGILGYSFLIFQRNNTKTETNCAELFLAGELARDIGCDYFEFKPAVNSKHHLIPISPVLRGLLLDQMEKLSTLNSKNFRVIYPQSITHLLNQESADQPKNYNSCPSLELRTVVTPSGIYPCPYKRGILTIGDVSKNFNDFWESKERINIIKKINPSRDCPFHCIRHETNLLLNTLSAAYRDGINLFEHLISKENTGEDIFL